MSRKAQRGKRLFQLFGPGSLWKWELQVAESTKGSASCPGSPCPSSLARQCQRTRLLAQHGYLNRSPGTVSISAQLAAGTSVPERTVPWGWARFGEGNCAKWQRYGAVRCWARVWAPALVHYCLARSGSYSWGLKLEADWNRSTLTLRYQVERNDESGGEHWNGNTSAAEVRIASVGCLMVFTSFCNYRRDYKK